MCISIPAHNDTSCKSSQMCYWNEDDRTIVSARFEVSGLELTCLVYPMEHQHALALTSLHNVTCLVEEYENQIIYRSMAQIPLRHIPREDGFHMFVLEVHQWDGKDVPDLISRSFDAFKNAGPEVCGVVFGKEENINMMDPLVLEFYEELAYAINASGTVPGHDLVIVIPPDNQERIRSNKKRSRQVTENMTCLDTLLNNEVITPAEHFQHAKKAQDAGRKANFVFSMVWEFFGEQSSYPVLGLIHNDKSDGIVMDDFYVFSNCEVFFDGMHLVDEVTHQRVLRALKKDFDLNSMLHEVKMVNLKGMKHHPSCSVIVV